MSNQETFLTPEGYKKLEEELQYLTTVRRTEVAHAIHEAKRQQAFLEGRIMTVETMLKSAVLIASSGPSDTVILGSRVTVVEEGFEPETYTIVGSAEANPTDGRISNESPVGKALMGHRAGDKVAFRAPGGLVEMKLLHIE
jgi:transcription elongation factor GreA